MGDSLKEFIDNYCIIMDDNYIKLSRFRECYKGFCSDNSYTVVDLNENTLKKYGIELVIMNKDKWLNNVRLEK